MGSTKLSNLEVQQMCKSQTVTARINTVTDVNTLQLITEVSEEDHSALSQIASRKSKTAINVRCK